MKKMRLSKWALTLALLVFGVGEAVRKHNVS